MLYLLNPRLWLAAAVLVALSFTHGFAYKAGKSVVRADWDKDRAELMAAALKQSEANAAETARRIKAQKESQDAHTAQIAQARRDADRLRSDADRLRAQGTEAARRWRDALADSAAGSQCPAAAEAIAVSSELFSRAYDAAAELAAYADAARIAGLQCERDYEALTP